MAQVKEVFSIGKPGNGHSWFENVAAATASDFLCGVELEVEDVNNIDEDKLYANHINVTHDDSLKNKGHEFIIAPSTFEEAIQRFNIVQSCVDKGDKAFSHRTSIHVHVNVCELEVKQLRQFILTYALFEPWFFEFVGTERENNIFCVPLYYTYLPNHYNKGVDYLVEKWHKYTAFNLKPLRAGDKPAFGTVEFRHLYGTGDEQVFTTWLKRIRDLYMFVACNMDFNITKYLESNGSVAELHAKVFTEKSMTIAELCRETVLDVKLSAGGLK